jgi:hypothetical protein
VSSAGGSGRPLGMRGVELMSGARAKQISPAAEDQVHVT